jgi:hypothetical protein
LCYFCNFQKSYSKKTIDENSPIVVTLEAIK